MADGSPVQVFVSRDGNLEGSAVVELGATDGSAMTRIYVGPAGLDGGAKTGNAAVLHVANFVAKHSATRALVVQHEPHTEWEELVVYPANAWPPILVRLTTAR